MLLNEAFLVRTLLESFAESFISCYMRSVVLVWCQKRRSGWRFWPNFKRIDFNRDPIVTEQIASRVRWQHTYIQCRA